MSKKNRKAEYDRLVANTKAGRKPGIDQDDGALTREFGAVIMPKEPIEEPEEKPKDKKKK